MNFRQFVACRLGLCVIRFSVRLYRAKFINRPRRMHSIDAVYCNRFHTQRGICVCVLFTLIYCAKTAEPIEMPFGELTHVGQTNIRWVEIPSQEVKMLGVDRPIEKHWESAAVYAAKAKGIIQSSITARYAMRPFVQIL